ncbi:GspH/FimT family pseudopilin [Alteromonas sp. ASW11-19]|uniref:Type II secretion system protein H n=1 Tax=Alteromonas salexigens TaxID=2982530 RepID=A0ABT2VQY5_9ALTE|nr:GspH/FimT family pseudopilin [Alteromonas salexigens]MCU7555723.1 GspH/FimT family pseudopilin [Alteromonas salexigens]
MTTRQQGLTLLELMITVAIVLLLITVGSPAIVSAQRHLSLSGAVENTYFMFQQARSHAVRQSSDIVMDFEGASSSWCIGLTDQADCDCSVVNSCTIDGVDAVLSNDEFPHTWLKSISFDDNDQALIDGRRGLALNSAGSAVLSDSKNAVRLELNAVGRVKICVTEGELGSYPQCDS